MTAPSVTVIVLNWNGKEHLAECLSSLRTQRYAGPTEIVLVDNGSEDGSIGYVREAFPDIRVISSPTNVGFSAGNNLAARVAETDLLAFLNNDTRADPGWLEALVAAVSEAPEVAAAGGRILNWDGSLLDFGGGGATLTGFGLQFGFGEPPNKAESKKDLLFACGGSMIVKRNLYWEVGGLDDDYFLFYEDVDLGWRFWLAGYRVVYAPDSVIYHRHHGSTHRLEDHRLAVLYERNALFTIYKNYDDRNLARVLPAALLLAADRATVLVEPDRSAFVMGGPSRPGAAPAATGAPAATTGDKLRESMKRMGYAATARRVIKAVRTRVRRRGARIRVNLARRVGGEGRTILVQPSAISRLIALEQFGSSLAALRAKRERVQRLRKRSDSEILELFKAPLEPGFDGPGFAEYHRRVVAGFGLDQLVEEISRRARPISHA